MIPNAVGPPFSAEGEAAAGRLRARGLDARAAQEPAAPRRGLPPRGPERPAAARRRRAPAGAACGSAGDGVRWLGEVGDDELARLYRGARAVAYVSLYEGFGLPVLEAMACGAPVVAARTGALEEVAGGAAVLVDPLDPDAIAAGLDRGDRRGARSCGRSGSQRARAFDWRKVARETVAVYREAAA